MNVSSSRSHTIFKLTIESQLPFVIGGAEDEKSVCVRHLNLVDLAGSERAGQSGSEGMRLKEGCNINKSLLALGVVISRLADIHSSSSSSLSSKNISNRSSSGAILSPLANSGTQHVPFRDSKLTRILQPCLGGTNNTLIICTLNSSPKYFEESLSTLKFASRARVIKNRPSAQTCPESGNENKDMLLLMYKKEIKELKNELYKLKDSEEKEIESATKEEQSEMLKMKLDLFEKMVRIHSAGNGTDENAVKDNMPLEKESRLKRKRQRRQTFYLPSLPLSVDTVEEDRFQGNDILIEENKALKRLLKDKEMHSISPISISTKIEDISEDKLQGRSIEEFEELEDSYLNLLVAYEEVSVLLKSKTEEHLQISLENQDLMRELSDIYGKIEQIQNNITAKNLKIEELSTENNRLEEALKNNHKTSVENSDLQLRHIIKVMSKELDRLTCGEFSALFN